MKTKRIFNLMIIILTAALVTWYSILWINYVRTPAQLNESDFRAFYTAGLIADRYGFNQVYDLELEQSIQETVKGAPIPQAELLTYNHPPLLLPVLALAAFLNYSTAYKFYGLFLLLLALAALLFFYKGLRSKNWRVKPIVLTLLSILLFEPLFISFLKDQDTALLLLGLAIWFHGILREDDRQAGLGLALTVIRPQISIFLAIPFLFRQRKVLGWYLMGASLLSIYSLLLVSGQGLKDFLNLIIVSSSGQDYGLNTFAMFNITGMVIRIFPAINSNLLTLVKWGFYGLALMGMILVWKKNSRIELRHVVLLVICSLFFSPHLHYHDLTALLVPLVAMLMIWVDRAVIQDKKAALLILCISVFLVIGSIFSAVYHIFPYILMIFILAGAWHPEWFTLRNHNLQKKTDQ